LFRFDLAEDSCEKLIRNGQLRRDEFNRLIEATIFVLRKLRSEGQDLNKEELFRAISIKFDHQTTESTTEYGRAYNRSDALFRVNQLFDLILQDTLVGRTETGKLLNYLRTEELNGVSESATIPHQNPQAGFTPRGEDGKVS